MQTTPQTPLTPGAMAYATAYRAALEAEDARQAAERGPVEPVCPEGVETRGVFGGTWVAVRGQDAAFFVLDDGSVRTEVGRATSPALLRYTADMVEHRSASDRQRKLDAVRAAEEAHRKAKAEYDRATTEHNAAARALLDARREAGL